MRRVAVLLLLALSAIAPGTLSAYSRWGGEGGLLYRADYTGVLFSVNPMPPGGFLNRDGRAVVTSDSDVPGALSAAMATWNGVPTSGARFQPLRVAASSPGGGDALNVFAFADTGSARSIVGSAVAVTAIAARYNGTIIDTDIYFSPEVAFSTTLYAGTIDLQETATHELGHALGAQHSSLLLATMWPFVGTEDTLRRALSDDDIAFVSSTYPSGPSLFGFLRGKVTFDTGTPVRGASVTAVDPSRGIVIGAISRVGDGGYVMAGVPPGNYYVYAEPLNSMIGPSNIGLSESTTDLSFAPAIFGSGAGTPVTVNAGSYTDADLTVSSQAPVLKYSFASYDVGANYFAWDHIPSGQQAAVWISLNGLGAAVRAEDILVLSPGVAVRPDSVLAVPGPSPVDRGMLFFTADVAPVANLTAAVFAIRQGSEIAFTAPVKMVPPGPMYRASSIANAAGGGPANLAPGEIASLYGIGLGPAEGVDGSVAGGQLSRALSGITVLANDLPAPLFYVSSGQINFQVPYEVSGLSSVGITIAVNGAGSNGDAACRGQRSGRVPLGGAVGDPERGLRGQHAGPSGGRGQGGAGLRYRARGGEPGRGDGSGRSGFAVERRGGRYGKRRGCARGRLFRRSGAGVCRARAGECHHPARHGFRGSTAAAYGGRRVEPERRDCEREVVSNRLTVQAAAFSRAFTPSTHSAAACFDSGLSPPTSASNSEAVTRASAATLFPIIHSVRAEPAAIEAVQPRVL